ncbi:hypothetical protein D3C76_68330 [compost metagenome]
METLQQEAFIFADALMSEAHQQIYQAAKETESFADIMLKYFLFFIEEKNKDYLNINVTSNSPSERAMKRAVDIINGIAISHVDKDVENNVDVGCPS